MLRHEIAHSFRPDRENQRNCCGKCAIAPAFGGSAGLDLKSEVLLQFGHNDAGEFGIRLNEKEMVWRLNLHPLFEACSDDAQGSIEFPRSDEELCYQLIEGNGWR